MLVFSLAGCTSPDSLLQRGNMAYQEGDLEKAQSLYFRALEHESTRDAAAYNLGLVYFHQGDYKRALGLFENASGVEVNQPLLRVYRARAYAHLGLKQEAERQFELAVSLYPGLGDAHLYRARLLAEVGRLSEAVEAIQPAFQFPDLREEAMLEAAGYLRRLKQPAQAAVILEQLLATHGDRYQTYIALADALLESDQTSKAEAFLLAGLGFNPGEPEGLYLLGVALQRQSKLDLARQLFQAVEQKNDGEWSEKANIRLSEMP